jgi:hypothetical protein
MVGRRLAGWAAWAVWGSAVAAGLAGVGCEGAGADREGMVGRVYSSVPVDQAYKAAATAIHNRCGSTLTGSLAGGRIASNYQPYNPAALGPLEFGRITNPAGYRTKTEALVEPAGEGSRVNVRVIVERQEFERSRGGYVPTAGDFLFGDDRRPGTPLDDQLGAGGVRVGQRWVRYRIDNGMSTRILDDVDRLLARAAANPQPPTAPPASGGTGGTAAPPTAPTDKPAAPARPDDKPAAKPAER